MKSLADVMVGSSMADVLQSLTPIDKKIPVHSRLILIRHGESMDNISDILSGGGRNPELTSKGLQQAKDLAEALDSLSIDVDVVVSSPLARAKHTADIIQKCAWSETPRLELPALREMMYGDLEGASMRDTKIRSRLAQILRHWHSGDTSFRVGGSEGESLDCLATRVVPVLQKLVAERPGKVVVAVCHSHVIKTILAILLSDIGLYKMHKVPQHNCGVNILDYDCREHVQGDPVTTNFTLYGLDLTVAKKEQREPTHATHRMKCITESEYVPQPGEDLYQSKCIYGC